MPDQPRQTCPAKPAVAAPREAFLESTFHLPRGTIFGNFQIIELLGSGGMGQVYVAEQRSPRRIVALKIIRHRDGADAYHRARFLREAAAVALLNHPYVIPIYESGESDDGYLFYAMERVDGDSLDVFVKRAKPTLAKKLELFAKICDGVQAAHRQGVIHRDLKPANILVDRDGNPRILDFGLAKLTADDVNESAQLSRDGTVVGTPAYMAPEQTMGRSSVIDTRADVYALGVILYLLVTGSYPYDVCDLPYMVMERIRTVEPTRPRTLVRDIATDLEAVMLKALAKEKDRRYQSPRDLGLELHRYLANELVEARLPTVTYRIGKLIARHKAASGVSAIAALLLVVTLTISFLRVDEARIAAEAERDRATAAECDANHNATAAARHANEAANARRIAEHRLADTLIAQGDVEGSLARWTSAYADYSQAYELYSRLSTSTIPAELGLWNVHRNAPPPLAIFTGHQGPILCMAISPDSRVGLSGSTDQSVKVWDLMLGCEIRTFTGHTDAVFSVQISPDGRMALSGDWNGTMKVWDLDAGVERHSFSAHSSRILCLAFAPDGNRAVSGSADGTAIVWDLSNPRMIRALTGHTASINAAAFSPDGRLILTGSSDRNVKLWDGTNDQARRTFVGHTDAVFSVAFSPDGRLGLSGGADAGVCAWDLSSGEMRRDLGTFAAPVVRVAVSPDGERILVGTKQPSLVVAAMNSDLILDSHSFLSAPITDMVFSEDTQFVLCAHGSDRFTLYPAATGPEQRSLTGDTTLGRLESVAISPDGRLLASSGWDTVVRLWDLSSGKVIRSLGPCRAGSVITTRNSCSGGDVQLGLRRAALAGHSRVVKSVDFSPDGRTIASGGWDKNVILWEIASGGIVHTLTGHAGFVQCVAFSHDGRLLASGSQDGTIRLWDANSGREIRVLMGHSATVESIRFSLDSSQLVSGSADKTVKVWDVAMGEVTRTFAGHTQEINSVAVSPDGQLVVLGDRDGMVTILDTATGHERARLIGHVNSVNSVDISPSGEWALSAGADHTLRVWDVDSGKNVRTLFGHADQVKCARFGGDGRIVVSAGADQRLIVWDFSRPRRYSELAVAAETARDRLQYHAEQSTFLLVLGEWFAFRGMLDWAIEMQERAQCLGAGASSVTLGQWHWRRGNVRDAHRAFRQARTQTTVPDDYVDLCLQGTAAAIAAEDGH